MPAALLDDFSLLRFSGPDTQAFLHGQLTCDVQALNPRTSTYGGYCTPKGRLLATLLLWRDDDGYMMLLPSTIAEPVRKLVSFRGLNLLKYWPVKARYQVILCRNVMIYFDQKTQDDIWSRFAQHLAPGGMIYIGHSERIATGPYDLTGQTTYRRRA